MSFGERAFGSSGGGGAPFGGNLFGAGSQDICTTCGANRSNGGLCICNQHQQRGFGSPPQQQQAQHGFGAFGVHQQQQSNLPQTISIIIYDHVFRVPCDGTPINQVVAAVLNQIGQQ